MNKAKYDNFTKEKTTELRYYMYNTVYLSTACVHVHVSHPTLPRPPQCVLDLSLFLKDGNYMYLERPVIDDEDREPLVNLTHTHVNYNTRAFT